MELAARIGQSLLEQNKLLSVRNEELENDLTAANESVSHTLVMKIIFLYFTVYYYTFFCIFYFDFYFNLLYIFFNYFQAEKLKLEVINASERVCV